MPAPATATAAGAGTPTATATTGEWDEVVPGGDCRCSDGSGYNLWTREIVVIGESAGSVAAPLYAGPAADRLPDARIVALADGSGSFPDAPELTGAVSAVWGTGDTMPDWPENSGLTAERWSSFPGLFVQSGRHAPGITFARHDYAYDHVQQRFNDLLSLVDANEAQIEEAGVDVVSCIAPGDDHTALTEDELYTEEVGGEPLPDWVARLVAGEPVADVHCTECAAG